MKILIISGIVVSIAFLFWFVSYRKYEKPFENAVYATAMTAYLLAGIISYIFVMTKMEYGCIYGLLFILMFLLICKALDEARVAAACAIAMWALLAILLLR